MKVLEFKKMFLKEEYLHRFSVIALHNDVKWIEISNDEDVPINMFVALRMKATLRAWRESGLAPELVEVEE